MEYFKDRETKVFTKKIVCMEEKLECSKLYKLNGEYLTVTLYAMLLRSEAVIHCTIRL